ncbi:uncharacterized protein [Solanum lycopersicum]|uniref:uncharacterized protein n=1 Tax=Solanum lycopersicum TaxID=4081 RepID=UPI000532D7DE|nr:uncharacterized protein LOC104647749 [Solanum lycopersicum]
MIAPLNRIKETSKKEVKKEKSLALKVTLDRTYDGDDEMTYLPRRFQKLVRKHRGFRKERNSNRAANANYRCHKCGKSGHFIKYYPMHKVENKEFPRPGGEKDRRRDLLPKRKVRKAADDYVEKKAFAVLGDSSSESEEDSENYEDVLMIAVEDDKNVFNSIVSLMA